MIFEPWNSEPGNAASSKVKRDSEFTVGAHLHAAVEERPFSRWMKDSGS
jgi:hypothetical protein